MSLNIFSVWRGFCMSSTGGTLCRYDCANIAIAKTYRGEMYQFIRFFLLIFFLTKTTADGIYFSSKE